MLAFAHRSFGESVPPAAREDNGLLLRCPIKSSHREGCSILSTAATRSARFICRWQRSHRSPLRILSDISRPLVGAHCVRPHTAPPSSCRGALCAPAGDRRSPLRILSKHFPSYFVGANCVRPHTAPPSSCRGSSAFARNGRSQTAPTDSIAVRSTS